MYSPSKSQEYSGKHSLSLKNISTSPREKVMRLIEMITDGNTYTEMKNNFLSIYLQSSHGVFSS